MRICVIGKYPPIEGGVSAQTYAVCHLLARAGHQVFVVSNADATEPEHRQWLLPGDVERLDADYPGGGFVRAGFTQPIHDDDLYYIPRGEPALTRLAAVASQLVRRERCELIIGWYLEPYVLAAGLVSAWTKVPYLIRHAGSDQQDLAAQPELGPAYREAVRASAGVLSFTWPGEGMGLPPGRGFGLPGLFLPPEFATEGAAMDLAGTARLLGERGWTPLRTEPFPAGTAVVGAYGKLGPSKGTVDLVRAVAKARSGGVPVGLALLGGGRGRPAVLDAVAEAALEDVTVTLPMLAPWRVPSFIRACTAVAFLERDFEVALHRPVPPVEILACGRPLLLSNEVVSYVLPGHPADDPLWTSVELVDPRDPDALAQAVRSVLTRPRPTAGQITVNLRPQEHIASWYADVFARVTRTVPPPVEPRPTAAQVLARHAPVLLRVLGPRLDVELPAAPNALLGAYAVSEALVPQVRAAAAEPGEPGRLGQLALAEQYAVWTRVDAEGLTGTPSFRVPVQRVPVLPERLDTVYPVASSWLRIAEFTVDAFAHLAAVRAAQPIATSVEPLDGSPQALLFFKAPNLNATISRLGPAVRALLSAADGTRSLAELADALQVGEARRPGLLRAVAELHRTGILSFRRPRLAGQP
jgi:glycosyltransferase involved in cell wall biosynthesis